MRYAIPRQQSPRPLHYQQNTGVRGRRTTCHGARYGLLCALTAFLLQANAPSATAALTTLSLTEVNTGFIEVSAFDTSLGVMVGANVQVNWSGLTSSSSGNPAAPHTYSFNAGPFTISGGTTQTTVNSFHNHSVSGGTSVIFSPYHPYFSSGSSFGFPTSFTSVAASHQHNINAQNWAVTTTTTFDYHPYADLQSLTVSTPGSGEIILPEFNTTLGTLLEAKVDVVFNAQTDIRSGVNPHGHGFGFTSGPFTVSGSVVSTIPLGGTMHMHTLSGFDSNNVFHGSDLSFFGPGGSTFEILPFLTGTGGTTGVPTHSHLVGGDSSPTPTALTQTTFWYLPAVTAPAVVPEPASFLAWSSFALVGFATTALRGRRTRTRRR